MLAKILSGANVGLDAIPVTCEVDIASSGLPTFTVVGLADRAVEESKDRVRLAIRNCEADFPARKITVNLAPADLPKEGPAYDLPIAMGVLMASGQIPQTQQDLLKTSLFVGELSLDGSLRKTHGILPLAILAKDKGLKAIFVPKNNAGEASIIDGLQVFALDSLQDLIKFLLGQIELRPQQKSDINLDITKIPHHTVRDCRNGIHQRRISHQF